MYLLRCIWAYIQGKKTSIATSICLTLAYLTQQGIISNELNLLIVGILTAFGITANVGNGVAKRNAIKAEKAKKNDP